MQRAEGRDREHRVVYAHSCGCMCVPVTGWRWGPVAVGTEGATGGTHWGEVVWLGSAVISKPGVRPGAQWALCWARVYQWPGGAGAL